MEMDNKDFDLSKMTLQVEDWTKFRLRPSIEKKVAYEQRMYSMVLRQLNHIQKGVLISDRMMSDPLHTNKGLYK